MANYNTNILTERAESFDAYVQFQVGSDYYRLKGIQDVTVVYSWTDEDRYADDGTIQLVRTGQQHNANINLVLTKSEGETNSTPSDTKTISYWIAQREAGNRVQISVVQVFVTKASSSNFLNLIEFSKNSLFSNSFASLSSIIPPCNFKLTFEASESAW